MKTFLHLAAPLRNVGDNALILGMRNLFKDYNLELKPLRSTVININLINEINENFDGLIIGGGGLLHAPQSILDRKSETTGTLIMLDVNNLKLLNKPLVIYGIGYNVFRGEQDLPHIAKHSILEMMKYSAHFSVRNDGSRERLSAFLNIPITSIIEVPDPGLYVTEVESSLSKNIKGKNLAIQIAADRLNYRFKKKKEIEIFIKNIKLFIDSSIEHTCWLVPHCPIDDEFINENFKGYKKIPLVLDLNRSKEVIGFYKKMEVVIGQRGHGNICPFGIGVPIISLVSHDKNLGFMRKIGFSEYSVSASDPNLTDKLTQMVKKIDSSYILKQKETIVRLKYISESILSKIKI